MSSLIFEPTPDTWEEGYSLDAAHPKWLTARKHFERASMGIILSLMTWQHVTRQLLLPLETFQMPTLSNASAHPFDSWHFLPHQPRSWAWRSGGWFNQQWKHIWFLLLACHDQQSWLSLSLSGTTREYRQAMFIESISIFLQENRDGRRLVVRLSLGRTILHYHITVYHQMNYGDLVVVAGRDAVS